ncbi:hypothetical protein OG689_27955 [Kitasatospora sp. NBC_00240]|uniref:hypothetical protein n=1 Tax=Kitasatospora sp. NBC_00240 TaxID=2903567 RepID=UPI0022507402|nr:hypothetical protein [Kitasatospora sp. NBC_00240]MCX5213060.1 hypothetical protein [Kitasatospora sp. NBC_00240]
MTDIKVDPAALRASAGLARAIGEELAMPFESVIRTGSAAAALLAGWSVADELGEMSKGWAPTFTKIRERIKNTATNLDATADGHEWNDQAIAQLWTPRGAG